MNTFLLAVLSSSNLLGCTASSNLTGPIHPVKLEDANLTGCIGPQYTDGICEDINNTTKHELVLDIDMKPYLDSLVLKHRNKCCIFSGHQGLVNLTNLIAATPPVYLSKLFQGIRELGLGVLDFRDHPPSKLKILSAVISDRKQIPTGLVEAVIHRLENRHPRDNRDRWAIYNSDKFLDQVAELISQDGTVAIPDFSGNVTLGI